MSFTKELRSWFFRPSAPPNTEGKKINLENGSRPDQDLFEKLTASHLNFKEAADRAKINTGAAIELEVGTVAVTSDVKAKANTSGFEADRTLVVHAGQLPTSAAAPNTIEDFTGDVLDVTPDATTTRNNYIFTLTASFNAWLLSRLVPGGGTVGQMLAKVSGTDYDFAWIDVPVSGEVNTASNIGEEIGEVFKQKTGEDLELRTIGSVDVYTTVATNGDIIEIGTDITEVLNYMQANLTFPPGGSSNTFSNVGGGIEVVLRYLSKLM
jgi:hypothetical protein